MYGGADMQPSPYAPGVNPFEGFPDEDELERIYRENEPYILRNHQLEDVNNLIFNFPVAGKVEEADISAHMEYIFSHPATQNAFKVELVAGVIIRHSETGKVRYFRPESNAFLLDGPLMITNRDTLNDAIDIMNGINIDDAIRTYRPDTKYVVQSITQINYYCWATNFPLGSNTNDTPEYITKNRSIITMGKSYGKEYANCCIFVALSQYLNPDVEARNHKMSAKKLLTQWVSYARKKSLIPPGPAIKPVDYQGLNWQHIPHFEDCFKVNVIIMSYLESGIVNTKYISPGKNKRNIYLNVYEGHLSWISNIERYANRFQCHHCKRLFPKLWRVDSHQKACKKMSKLKFPSGTYVYYKTVFEELEQVGILVPQYLRSYSWVTVFDFESLLIDHNITTTGGNTKFTSIHIPVSVSICSNVMGFECPHFIMSDDPRKLVYDMMSYIENIQKEVSALAFKKWGAYLMELKHKLRERKKTLTSQFTMLHGITPVRPVAVIADMAESQKKVLDAYIEKKKKFLSSDPMMRIMISLYQRFALYMQQHVILGFNSQKYDMKLIIGQLVEYLLRSDTEENLAEGKIKYKTESIDALLIDLEEEEEEEEDGDSNKKEQEPNDYMHCDKDELDEWLGKDIKPEKLNELFTENRDKCMNYYGDDIGVLTVDQLLDALELNKSGQIRVLKRNNAYASVANNFFNFMDVSNFLPPATNYRNFLKAYSAEGQKSFFPYEYCTSYQKLFDPLPAYNDPGWCTRLRGGVHLLEEEYIEWEEKGRKGPMPNSGQQNYNDIVKRMKQEGMTTLADLLRVYNNDDTKPFISALETMLTEYFNQGIDIFKVAVSIPGISRIKVMQHAQKNGVLFPLFHAQDEDMYHLIKEQTTGGPSIVFNRFTKVDHTYVHADQKVKVKGCEGYDANALYVYCFKAPMPCYMYVRRMAPDFVPQYRAQLYIMFVWLEEMSHQHNILIRHKMNTGYEIRALTYFLDGLAVLDTGKMIAYEYLSCFHHGHECKTPRTQFLNDQYKKWEIKKSELIAAGYEVCFIWDCDFRPQMYDNPVLRKKYTDMKPDFLKQHPNSVTEQDILTAVEKEEIFGFLLVDLRCSQEVKKRLEDFPPVFCNHEVSYDDIGDEMKSYLKKNDIKFTQRRLLMSGFEADEILVNNRLLAFYLELGLTVRKVHLVIEYVKATPFTSFVEQVTKHRKAAAKDPKKAVTAAIYKLIGYETQFPSHSIIYYVLNITNTESSITPTCT